MESILFSLCAVIVHRDVPGWSLNSRFKVQGQRKGSPLQAGSFISDFSFFPFHNKQEKEKGRKIYLCTGSNISIAHKIAGHLGLFDDVFATYVKKNFVGSNKAKVLVNVFGEKGFDYVGNSKVDLKVWSHAREAVIVNASGSVIREAVEEFGQERVRILK